MTTMAVTSTARSSTSRTSSTWQKREMNLPAQRSRVPLSPYSHVSGLGALLQRIPVYPEAGHDERIKAFYSMAFMQHWLLHEAERHDNRYTLTRAASQLALFTGRLLLAHNRRLFPYHKWLPRALESVPEKPSDLMVCFNDLLNEPSGDHATALFERVRGFKDWGVSDLEAYTWFMTDVEWSWMSERTPMEDW